MSRRSVLHLPVLGAVLENREAASLKLVDARRACRSKDKPLVSNQLPSCSTTQTTHCVC